MVSKVVMTGLNLEYVYVICLSKKNWTIVVWVVRQLFVVNDHMSNSGDPFSMELLLMDENVGIWIVHVVLIFLYNFHWCFVFQHDKIQAIMSKSLIYKFEKEFKDGFML